MEQTFTLAEALEWAKNPQSVEKLGPAAAFIYGLSGFEILDHILAVLGDMGTTCVASGNQDGARALVAAVIYCTELQRSIVPALRAQGFDAHDPRLSPEVIQAAADAAKTAIDKQQTPVV